MKEIKSEHQRELQQPLPDIYLKLTDPELRIRIESARQSLGKRLVILGHHYQQDDVVDFADFTGDSFELPAGQPSNGGRNLSCSAACISWRNRRTFSPKNLSK